MLDADVQRLYPTITEIAEYANIRFFCKLSTKQMFFYCFLKARHTSSGSPTTSILIED